MKDDEIIWDTEQEKENNEILIETSESSESSESSDNE